MVAIAAATAKTYVFGRALTIGMTKNYELRWNDERSGAPKDVAFWHPKADADGDLRPLGTVTVAHHSELNDKWATILVGDSGDKKNVADPIDYNLIWDDRSSGSTRDGSIWRPVCPDGYAALGDVATASYDKKPDLKDIWCVKEEYTFEGEFSKDPIWTDKGTGASKDLAVWAATGRQANTESDQLALSAGTFFGIAEYNKQPEYHLARYLLINNVATIDRTGESDAPVLTSMVEPPAATEEKRDRWVVLPFTSLFKPDDRVSLERINTPFRTIERLGRWKKGTCLNNVTDRDEKETYAYTTGITTSQSQKFEQTTGISVSATVGVEVGVASASMTVEVSHQFTYGTESSREDMSSVTITKEIIAAPKTLVCMYTREYVIRSRRLASVAADGTPQGPWVGNALPYKTQTTSLTQYPPPKKI